MDLKPRLLSGGKLEPIDRGWKLIIPSGGASRYRLSQIDDHIGLARGRYPCRPPFHMELEARVSSAGLPGTWGFGLWNDPYGFTFSFAHGFRLPALPNAAWFFYSSRISHLSFREDKPANGFLAQVFSSPKLPPRLVPAAITFLFSRRAARRLLARIISEDAAQLAGGPQPGPLDVTAWHTYALDWTENVSRFFVDGAPVLETPISPRGPLGIVIWIDNQHAAYTDEGRVSLGVESNPEPAWMEARDLQIG